MKEKGTVLFMVAVMLLSAASGAIYWKYSTVLGQNRILEEKLEQTLEDLEISRARLASLKEQVPLPQPDWEKLTNKNRPDPRAWLRENIISREDLIPWEGIHGGTMKIYDSTQVWFVGPRWCLTWVEDGHIGGYMLLRFDTDEGEPRWHLLDSELSD